MSIAYSIRTRWRRLFSPPTEPARIIRVEHAAQLAENWRGVRRAEVVKFMVGLNVRLVVAITFWPWVFWQHRTITKIAAEVSRRRPLVFPAVTLMDAKAVQRMLARQAEFDQAERSRWET